MSRGIHRFVITFGHGVVKVRAQSQSLRGNAYTVRHARKRSVGSDPVVVKQALAESLEEVYQAKS